MIIVETTLLDQIQVNGRISKKLYEKVVVTELDRLRKENRELKAKVEKLMECVEDFIYEEQHLSNCLYDHTGSCICMDRTYYNRKDCLIRASQTLKEIKEGGE